MKKRDIGKRLWNVFVITAGSLMYAAGLGVFLSRTGLACGGVSGISIILDEVTGIPTGIWMLAINAPIAAVAIWKFGLRFFLSTGYAVLVSSLGTEVFERFVPLPTEDRLLCVVYGSILCAVGIGLVLLRGATTGGTDVIVRLIHSKFRHIGTARIMMVSDAVIVVTSGVVFGRVDIALYAGLGVIIQNLAINTVLYGTDQARLVYIISEKHKEIARRIMDETDTGVTLLRGEGAYTGKDKSILMCAVRMRAFPLIRDIVRAEDEEAFVIVGKATSVFGEGFSPHSASEL